MLLEPITAEASPSAPAEGAHPEQRRRHTHAARLFVYPPGEPRREMVEGFIRDVYARRYDACVTSFATVLVALMSEGRILAAAGYRPALQPLFLERYLDAPVEARLRALTPEAPARARIVEVGHLAATRPGAGRMLMPLLGVHLAGRGFEWVVSTATTELRTLFGRMGLEPLVLGTADPRVLGADAAQWGTYYDHHPQVVAGSIVVGMSRIAPGLLEREDQA